MDNIVKMEKNCWSRRAISKIEPWKIDIYSGIAGAEKHEHKVISGAIISDGKLIGGETYYHREACGKILINKDEDGKSLL